MEINCQQTCVIVISGHTLVVLRFVEARAATATAHSAAASSATGDATASSNEALAPVLREAR